MNPPGNERPAIEFLRDYLSGAGFDCELLAPEPERPNLVARLASGKPGPTLLLLSHVDTVLADPGDWRRDPWSGEVDDDGFLWGRGALDMKNQTAAEAVAAATLARGGWRPARGELIVCAVVDEEVGGVLGAQWLTREHPDKVRADYVINEGGGAVMPYGDRRLYGICCGEKGPFRFRVVARGAAGHASIPAMGDNALLKLAPVLSALAGGQPSFDVTEIPRAWLEGLGVNADDPAGALEDIRAVDPRLADLVAPTLGVTVVATRAEASHKINVIPARAELQIDCRVPPGLGVDTALHRVTEVLGELNGDVSLEFLEQVTGNFSSHETELYAAFTRWIAANDPGAEVVPVILPGFTDSRWWREAFPDCVAYGFFPQRYQDLYAAAPLIHGADERIDVRDLGFAAACYRDVAQELLG